MPDPVNKPFTVDYPRATDDPLRSIQRAYERLNSLQHTINQLPPSLTAADVTKLVGPAAQQALSIGGSNPIYITEITGATALSMVLSGTHANRIVNTLPSSLTSGTIYFETDRTVTYQLVNGAWLYSSGVMTALIANIPTDLGTADAGFTFAASDYLHTYHWDGTVWSYAPGDEGSGRIIYFTVAPRAGKWQKLDGSGAVRESLANGTTQLVAFSGLAAGVVPDLITTPTYIRSNGTCTGVVNVAVAPLFVGTAATLTGTNSAPALTMNSYTPAGTNSAPTFTGSLVTLTTGTAATGGGVSVVTGNTFTPAGTVSAPVFTGTPATLTGTISAPVLTMASYTPAGTIGITGQPRNLDAIPYYRL